MCGICGVIYKNKMANSQQLISAINILDSRGPDNKGLFIDRNVGLSHSRLSILDLDEQANQPMISKCGRYIIVYNGEIYNFKEIRKKLNLEDNYWNTQGDTEVLLESYLKWGENCLEEFNGMFAFCIYDKKEQTFFCARDRIGKKPFYYSFCNGNFLFASRPSSLFILDNIPKDLDKEALRNYLEIGYIPKELSIYKHIKMLPAGCKLVYKNGNINISRYWDYRNIEVDRTYEEKTENQIIDELDELLLSSVKYRMISDVPIGSFLSGGIDSSLITAMMVKLSNQKISTFSIGFEEKKWDESIFAKEVADYLQTDHYSKILKPKDLINLMPIFFKNFDEPFFDSSAFPTMAVSKLAKENVTVVLTGDGADELFGGYHYYLIVDKLKYFYKFPLKLRKILSQILYQFPSHQIKLLAQAIIQKDLAAAFAFSRSITKDFDDVANDDIMKQKSIKNKFYDASLKMPKNLDAVEKALRIDAHFTLPDDYLQKVDISSMAYSLETRSPFLDYRIIEWAAKLPKKYKVNQGINKYLLRKLAYRYIPKEIIDRPKQGFRVPIGEWLKKDLYDDFVKLLESYQNEELNISNISKLLNEHKLDKRDIHPLLWAVYIYLKWEKNR